MTFGNYCSGIAICFSYNYLIIDRKDHLSIKKVVKVYEINQRLRTVCFNVTFTDNWQNLRT